MTAPDQNPEPCPPWCIADHAGDDYFRLHRGESGVVETYMAGLGVRPAVHVGLGRVDEPERRGKTVVTVGLITGGGSAHLSPQEAIVMADVLDALAPDCPSPTDVLSVRLREAAALATNKAADQ